MISLKEKYGPIVEGEDDLEFNDLIVNAFVSSRNKVDTRIINDIHRRLILQHVTHNDLIDYLIHQLLKAKQDNRITKGYDLGSGFDINGKICNKMNSFHVSYLKSTAWKLLHLKIGKEEFVKTLLFCNCFLRIEVNGIKNQIQIFGESFQNYSSRDFNYKNLSKNRMLYREDYQVKKLNPIPSGKEEALKQIFSSFFKDEDRKPGVPKKFRKVYALIGKLILNHKSCNYPYIVDQICPIEVNYKSKDIRTVGTPCKQVIKLVVCFIDSIFPLEFFGTKYNKSTVMKKVARFIMAPRMEKILKSSLLDGIKIKDIAWLSTNNNSKLNKQDFMKRRQLFEIFLTWMLSHFVSKLVACFFHVTETVDSLLFYRHQLWKKLTKSFMDRYFAKYLNSKSPERPVYSFVDADKIQGKMRLIPKAKDFRVINVPFRGTRNESFQYWSYLNYEVKPVRSILLEARINKKYSNSYCFSVGDIPKHISKFRERISCIGDERKEFYYIKFDAKSCYDTIPREKVKLCSQKLIPDGQTFVYRQISAGSQLRKLKNSNILVKVEDIDRLNIITKGNDKFKNKFLFDQNKTVILSSADIMEIIDYQLDKTVVQVRRKCYSRTNGIFQGFPLSGIFCDIVYDELVETYLKDVLDDEQSLLLRVADDFMVISTDADQIRNVLRQTQTGFGDFQVKINNDKTKLKLKLQQDVDDEVIFCGLTIDMKDLNVVKTADSYGALNFYGKSYKELYARLIWLVKTRIHNHIIKSNNSERYMEINLVNTLHILRNSMQLFLVNRRKKTIQDKFDEDGFTNFCHQLLQTVWNVLRLDGDVTGEVNLMWYRIVTEECLKVVIELLIADNF